MVVDERECELSCQGFAKYCFQEVGLPDLSPPVAIIARIELGPCARLFADPSWTITCNLHPILAILPNTRSSACLVTRLGVQDVARVQSRRRLGLPCWHLCSLVGFLGGCGGLWGSGKRRLLLPEPVTDWFRFSLCCFLFPRHDSLPRTNFSCADKGDQLRCAFASSPVCMCPSMHIDIYIYRCRCICICIRVMYINTEKYTYLLRAGELNVASSSRTPPQSLTHHEPTLTNADMGGVFKAHKVVGVLPPVGNLDSERPPNIQTRTHQPATWHRTRKLRL